MPKIIDMDFHIFTKKPEETLSQFERFSKVTRRQAYEALNALICVIQDLQLQEVADKYQKSEFQLGAFDLAINTMFGHKLMFEDESGKLHEAFHDYWTSCQQCEEEMENDDACCIEEDGVETWVCPDCFCESLRGYEE